MNILDHNSDSLETIFLVQILKFFDTDTVPDPGIFFTLDPGGAKFGSGINIPDPQHWFQLLTGSKGLYDHFRIVYLSLI